MEVYGDWRGRRADPDKHDGKRAAAFICVVEIIENVVFISNASNLVSYFYAHMHYSLAHSANMVTNYMGTSFLLTLLGGFFGDAFLMKFWAINLFASMELLGLVILTIQAHGSSLHPGVGQSPSSSQAAMLYVGLYAMALGAGGIKANLPAHGADQFEQSEEHHVSSFFNWFFFCLCTGGMLAVTVLVWVQENKGWEWGLEICSISLAVGILIFIVGLKYYRHKIPSGSPLTRIFKVFVYTARNRNVHVQTENMQDRGRRYDTKFRSLEKATVGGHVNAIEVEETKSFLRLLPIFASTIMMNCCLAQLQTFSVQQGKTMNTKLSHSFHIPPASLTAIPLIIMLISVPLYDCLSSSAMRKYTKMNIAIPPLRRIGTGLVLASVSMVIAALVELKRRNADLNGTKLSVFWLGWQYLFLGVSDMFTLAGMLEFFYSQAPHTMRSLCTSLSWCSTSMGYFLSSVIVTVVNSASRHFGSKEWLGGSSLNENRLELFYALLAVLNFINFFNYIYWARWY